MDIAILQLPLADDSRAPSVLLLQSALMGPRESLYNRLSLIAELGVIST